MSRAVLPLLFAPIIAALAVILLSESAFASTPSAPAVRFHVGADGTLLFRQEAGGSRTVLPTVAPRLSLGIGDHWSVAASYGFFRGASGIGIGEVVERVHRLQLRGEFALPLRATRFVFAVGAVPTLHHATFPSGDDASASRDVLSFRPGLLGGFAWDIRVPIDSSTGWVPHAVILRAGVDTVWSGARLDVVTVLGVSVPLGAR